FELMPDTDEGQVTVDVEMPVGTRIERTEAIILRLEQMVAKLVPEKTDVMSSIGGGWMGGSTHRGSVTLRLLPKDERTRSSNQIAQVLRRELSGLPGVVIRARSSGGNQQMTRMLSGGGGESRLSFEIRGYDLAEARALGLRAKAIMDRTAGIADARIGREEGRPELAVRVDRQKAALLGLRLADVADTIQTNIQGTTAAYYRERGFEYPIVVRLRPEDRERAVSVDDVRVSTAAGQVVQAKNLIDIDTQLGPVQIERKNQERILYINAELETALSEAMERLTQQVPRMNVPRGFSVGFGSEAEEQAKAFQQLQMVLILAIILVYAVMASQYESLRDPFVIIFSIPLAAIGVVAALKLTSTPFSMQAYIGVIMLAGIVVSNAILLVDYTNTLRRRDGMKVRPALIQAGRTRLRPILMTTLTTVLGLVPMSLGIGEGSELQAPLARVVIGGLLTSTLITLVFVPAMYTVFEEGWKALWTRSHAEE
ncbi:MAG: mdtC 2, partial [Acidobacteria bacterium]|nr:mdtC 2 [Acidobacteriota bacterium]